jgi:hypothetical protein
MYSLRDFLSTNLILSTALGGNHDLMILKAAVVVLFIFCYLFYDKKITIENPSHVKDNDVVEEIGVI